MTEKQRAQEHTSVGSKKRSTGPEKLQRGHSIPTKKGRKHTDTPH
jgi:hypothetical protein